jgi:NADH pyrophosphatase NudC (nudix superfamily)
MGRMEARLLISASMDGKDITEAMSNSVSPCVPLALVLHTWFPLSKALNNYMHPRTDPVVIILTVSPDNNRILLGRNVRTRLSHSSLAIITSYSTTGPRIFTLR